MVVMHLCDNPPCVRLDHLRLGTHAENTKMAGERGQLTRLTKGERNGQAKLTEAQVREIRRLYESGRTTKEIAGMYDITFTNVSMITTRATWKHVT
jgi:DNA invertase Pin-like site-specific DNA recombinase